MKQIINGAAHRNGHSFASHKINLSLFSLIIAFAWMATGCQKSISDEQQPQLTSNAAAGNNGNVIPMYTGLSPQTKAELQQARAATTRYRDINNALSDGYEDISVVVPQMGHHYMNMDYLQDGKFDPTKPEILVYNKNEDETFDLVAVEYALDINLPRPEGFTGDGDVWDENTGFGLWLLHAWVWRYNPNGVFNPLNPDVHTH